MLNLRSWAERYGRKHWFAFNGYWIASMFGMREKAYGQERGCRAVSGDWVVLCCCDPWWWHPNGSVLLFFFPACFSHKHVLDLLKLLSLKVWFLVLDTQRNFVFNRCFCHLGKLGCDICVDLSTEAIVSIWFCNSLLGRDVLNLELLFSFLSENNEVRWCSSHFLSYLHS